MTASEDTPCGQIDHVDISHLPPIRHDRLRWGDKVGKRTGFSRNTLRKAAIVANSGEEDIIAWMDKSGNISGALRLLYERRPALRPPRRIPTAKHIKREIIELEKRLDTLLEDLALIEIDETALDNIYNDFQDGLELAGSVGGRRP